MLFRSMMGLWGKESTYTKLLQRISEKNAEGLELHRQSLQNGLSVRSFNCLKRAGINTVEDLVSKSEEEMMKVRNLGRKSLEEVIWKLASLGFNLHKDDE